MTKPENMATVSASGAHGIFDAIADEMVASSRRNVVLLKVHGVVGKIKACCGQWNYLSDRFA